MPNGPPDNATPSTGKRFPVLSSVEGSKDGIIDPLIETVRRITKSCNIAQAQSSVSQPNIVNNNQKTVSETIEENNPEPNLKHQQKSEAHSSNTDNSNSTADNVNIKQKYPKKKEQTSTNSNHAEQREPQAKTCWVLEIGSISQSCLKKLPQNLFFALEKNSKILFLVDSGCEISILPKLLSNGVDQYFKPQSKTIQGIGNSTIHPIGSVEKNLKLGNMNPMKHTFWVTEESRDYGIIGIDILRANKLIFSPHTAELFQQKHNRIARLYTARELNKATTIVSNKNVAVDKQRIFYANNKFESLLDEFPELTETPNYNRPVKHGHSLKINVENLIPKMIKARKCNGIRRRMVEENFDDLINRGAMSRGTAITIVSPITIVPKKDGNIRVCIDYTTLNAHTRPISYPLPRIDELPEFIPGGTKIFSCLDLKEAYYSLPIDPYSRNYAAIISHHGVFIPHRTTFGLKNAPMRFQQMMDSILINCTGFVYVYLDDILIYSETESEHLRHLRKVLQTLFNNGLYLNKKKCVFAKSQLEFLGHSIGVDGVDVLDSKVEAIKKLPMPTNRKELKRFIGMTNYYYKHLPRLAETTAPLNEISGGPKRSNKACIKLNEVQIKAYQDTLALLANAATLAFENHEIPLILYSDASDTHVGSVLEQEGEHGVRRPLAYFSKKLPPLKRVRSTFYKELRALYLSLKHFQSRIIGRELIVRTDSQSVEKAINKPIGDQSPMEQRYIAAIKEFNPTVKHIAGANNLVADTLSRPPQVTTMHVRIRPKESDDSYVPDTDSTESVSDPYSSDSEEELITAESLNRTEIARLQKEEPELISLALRLNKEVEYLQPENLAVIKEGNNKRIILPTSLRLTAFEVAHGYLHLGKEKSILTTAKEFWWPTLNKDVQYWVKTCVDCQATKVFRHNRPKIGLYPNNSDRFQFVHVDLMGPMSVVSENNKYILTVKDRGTGYLVTAPISDKRAETVKNAFIQSWCGPFGVPQVVVTDNGREFANAVLASAFKQLGVDHRFVPPYTPQSNGYIERQHRSINIALRTLADKTTWSLHLPLITASINNSLVEGNPFTPSQLALGTCTNVSGRVLFNRVSEVKTHNDVDETNLFLYTMSRMNRRHKRYAENSVYYEPGLFQCKKVWIKRKNKTHLSSQYHGPYTVHAFSEYSMIIEKNARLIKVSIRNVKCYFPREDLDAAGEKVGINKNYNLRERRNEVNYAESSSEGDSD